MIMAPAYGLPGRAGEPGRHAAPACSTGTGWRSRCAFLQNVSTQGRNSTSHVQALRGCMATCQ